MKIRRMSHGGKAIAAGTAEIPYSNSVNQFMLV
jgi:hypothetical protein